MGARNGAVYFARFMRRLVLGLLLAMSAASCGPNGAGKPGEQPTPPPENLASEKFDVGTGYEGLAWGTSREEVLKKHPDAKPSAKNPKVLVRASKIAGDWPATEAYFFGERGLEEVEIKIEPKRSPQEAAALGISLDRRFKGTHETSLADDHMYQLAWFGEDTDVRLTYDLRESMTAGPVITFAMRTAARPTATVSSAPSTPSPGGSPAKQFSNGIRGARKLGLALTGASAEPGRLTLIYGDAQKAVELIVTSNPKTGEVLGYVELPRSAKKGNQRSAEAVLDTELKKGDVTKIVFGGKAGFEHLITVWFGDRFVTLDPKADNLLAGGSYAKPE